VVVVRSGESVCDLDGIGEQIVKWEEGAGRLPRLDSATESSARQKFGDDVGLAVFASHFVDFGDVWM